jgi:hypothetical protein
MRSRRAIALLFAGLAFMSFGIYLHGEVPDVPTGQWLQGPALAQPREGAVSVALDDGRVLVIGGRTANGPVNTVEVFDTNGAISAGAPMLAPHVGHTATKLPDGSVLVIGGTTITTTDSDNGPVSSEAVTDSAEFFDPTAGVWYPAASLSVARSGHTATAVADGHVLVAGGTGADGAALDSFEVFNPESATFPLSGVLSAARKEHAAAAAGVAAVLVVGGRNADGVLATGDIIDIASGNLTSVVLNAPRAGASATTLLDGKVLIVGGSDGSNDLASAEVLDPVSGVSTATASMAQARRGHQALLLDHNATVLITGGTATGAAVTNAEQFIAWSETFVSTGLPASERASAVVSKLPGAAGVALRADNDGASASTELYGFATLQTDSDDYAPGTTVVVTGSGWQPGETVTLLLHEVATGHADRTYTAVADGVGRISNRGFTPDQQHIGVRFYLTARGAASQAQATFTDGQPSTVTMTPNTRSVAPGGSAIYPISVVFGGNATPCTVSLSVTPSIGTGITASFDTTNLIGAGNETRSGQLTLATTISGPPAGRTPPGSYPFTLTVTRGGSCQGNGTLTASGTLIVYGAAAKLAFDQQPTNATGGSAVTPAVTVQVLDANNNVVGDAAAPITVAIGNNPASGTLSGTLTTNAVNGVATFVALSIDKVGTGYTLAATSTGLTSATSNAFNIAVGPPAQVRVETAVNGTGTVVPAQNVASASSITVYSIGRDAGGNFIDNVAADTWSLVSITGGVLPGDLNPAGNKKSAVFTGNAAGSAAIRTTVATLTSIDSGTLTVASTSVNTTTGVSSSLNPSLFGQSVSFTATVSPASGATPPTGSVQFVVDGVNFGSAVALNPSGSNGVATSLPTAALTVLGSPHSVTAQYLPTGFFNTSSGALAGGQTVNKVIQTITVTQSAPATAVYNTSFTVSATGGSSGNAVVIASSGACTGGGSNSASITMGSGTGTCTVTFNQGGDANYNAAAQVGQSTTAQKANQVITVVTPAPANAEYNASFTVSATGGGSGNPVTYTSAGVCSVNDTVFTMTSGTGSCTVHFNQAGDENYSAAPQITETVAAQKADQTITVTITAPPIAVYQTSFTVTANGGASGNSVTYSATGVCSNVGATFTMTSGTGTCTVHYDQAGDSNYNAALQITETVTAQKVDQTITVTTTAPPTAVYQTSFAVAANGGASGNSVTYSAAGVCSNVGATFTMTSGTGTCTVRYDQDGDSNYNAAPQITETVTAQKADQTITVTTPAPSNAVYNTSFTVLATPTSGLAASYSSDGVCSVAGATYAMTSGLGTCTVKYDQAGNDNYNPAPQVTESVTAEKANQTITVTTHAPATAVYNTSFTVAATGGGSGNPVTFNGAGVCSNSAASFTMTSGTGSCSVKYDQAGNDNYNAAPQVIETVTAQKAGQTIHVGTSAPSTAIYDTSFTVAATGGGSGNLVTYSAAGVCASVGPTFTMTSGIGTCTVKYDQAGDGNYHAAPQVTESVTAQKADQTISFGALANKVFGDAPFTVSATASSGLPVSFAAAGSCSVSGSTVTITATGLCTVTATQGGNLNYNVATPVSQTFNVATWTLTGFYQPATMGGVYNTVKGGSTVPLKFNVYQGATGTNERTDVGAVKAFQYAVIACSGGLPEDPVDVVSTGGTTLRYDTTGHQFVQNWQTDKKANVCYTVTMTTQDGSTIVAYFKTK